MPDVLALPLLASRASDFVRTIGVNVHLLGGQSNAWDLLSTATIIADLQYLGVSTIRDNIYDLSAITPRLSDRYDALARAGFTFDFTVGSSQSDLAGMLASLDAFERSHPGAIRYVEGPNEINYNPFTYQGASGQAAAIAFQADLSRAVHADPLLTGVQTLDFTGGGRLFSSITSDEPMLGVADLANIHVYPANGDPPDWYIAATASHQYGQALTLPFVTTEAGYNTDSGAGYGVSEDLAAKFTLDLLLDSARAGSISTMIYELFDLYADAGLTTYDDHWGLFYADGTPKPAASAIHDLVTLLADGASDTILNPTILDVSLTGLPDAGRYWLLQKDSQTFDLVVWSEPALWNNASHTETAASDTTVSIGLDTTFASLRVYDPILSSSAIQSITNTDHLLIGLSDDPLVIELSLTASPVSPGDTGTPPTDTSESVYRFFSLRDGSHLFTTSVSERDTIIQSRPDLVSEGVGFQAFANDAQHYGAVPVFRFFDIGNGTHFYTADAHERDLVMSTRSDMTLEGIAFYVSNTPAADEMPVWRFFDTSNGTHLYSSSPSEHANILASRPDLQDEGVAFYVPK